MVRFINTYSLPTETAIGRLSTFFSTSVTTRSVEMDIAYFWIHLLFFSRYVRFYFEYYSIVNKLYSFMCD